MPNKKQFRQLIFALFVMLFSAACNLVLEGQITPIPTPDIPQVEFLSPANNQQVVEGIVFDIEIVARDNNPGIGLVELYIDDALINAVTPISSTSEAIFTTRMNWLGQGVGLHIFEAIAYRPDGTQGDSAIITVEVIARDE
jgi:Big-like domain-containing protein